MPSKIGNTLCLQNLKFKVHQKKGRAFIKILSQKSQILNNKIIVIPRLLCRKLGKDYIKY